jgi:hypothetical protein
MCEKVKKGDQSEEYIVSLIKKYCISVERVGNTGSMYDIIYSLDDNIKRGIQVKTLSLNKHAHNSYRAHIRRGRYQDKKYPDDCLLIFVHIEHNRYAICFAKDIPKASISLAFGHTRKTKNQQFQCADRTEFEKRLQALLPLSEPIHQIHMSIDIAKEYACIERFVKFCAAFGLQVKRNCTNIEVCDLFIGEISAQIKYCSVLAIGCVSSFRGCLSKSLKRK